MRHSALSMRSLSGSLLACLTMHCSAGGSAPGASVSQEAPAAGGGPRATAGDSRPTTGSGTGFVLANPGDAVGGGGVPRNIGTELACDGQDENGNGVVDDVDKGQDGLCDCLQIGFLGELASDAGSQTGAFEAWLNARSDVPVAHIGARDPLTAEALANLQVLVVGNMSQRANGPAYSAAELEVLRSWVEQGGGLMTLAGYTARETDITATAQLLAPFGLGYDAQGRGPGVLGTGAPPVIVRGLVAPGHPTLEGLTALGVYNAYPVTGDGQVLVQDGAFVLAMAKDIAQGRVLAFSDEWITQDALWTGMANRPLSPCQQRCNQCNSQCSSCDRQCTDCQNQPCQGGQIAVDGGTCARGCDQGCASCSANCDTCEAACQTCSAAEANDTLDIPRFWLNLMRWLTPANECQVPIPADIVF